MYLMSAIRRTCTVDSRWILFVTPDEVNAVSGVPFDPVLSAVAASCKQTTVERSSHQTVLHEAAQSLLSQVSNHQQLLVLIAELAYHRPFF